MSYKIFDIPLEKYELFEQLGTKSKFWYKNKNEIQTLFKIGRENTGENWVEVMVAEICEQLDIPHAKYDFATWNNNEGTITESFVPEDGRLVLGNELLAVILKDIEYDSSKRYGLKEYKLMTIFAILKSIKMPINFENNSLDSAFDVFVGYIMLDCLISNPDRHHENWGIISYNDSLYLTPTYDHASGLGCREPEDRKEKRLITKDLGFTVESFVRRAKTPFYDLKDAPKLDTLQAFVLCCKFNKKASLYWLKKLQKLDLNKIEKKFQLIPNNLINEVSIKFALQMLKANSDRLIVGIEVLKNEE